MVSIMHVESRNYILFTHLRHHKILPSHNLEYHRLIRLHNFNSTFLYRSFVFMVVNKVYILLFIFILLGSYHMVKSQLHYKINFLDVLHPLMNIINKKITICDSSSIR